MVGQESQRKPAKTTKHRSQGNQTVAPGRGVCGREPRAKTSWSCYKKPTMLACHHQDGNQFYSSSGIFTYMNVIDFYGSVIPTCLNLYLPRASILATGTRRPRSMVVIVKARGIVWTSHSARKYFETRTNIAWIWSRVNVEIYGIVVGGKPAPCWNSWARFIFANVFGGEQEEINETNNLVSNQCQESLWYSDSFFFVLLVDVHKLHTTYCVQVGGNVQNGAHPTVKHV